MTQPLNAWDLAHLRLIAAQLLSGNYDKHPAPLDMKRIGRGIGQEPFTVPPQPRDLRKVKE